MNQEQRAALRKVVEKDMVGPGISRATILQLLDYIETLEKDAGRYRWQPIETAPQDGTVFLGRRWGMVREAYRVQRDDCEMWCFGGASGSVEFSPLLKPTHWIPLPDTAMKGETE